MQMLCRVLQVCARLNKIKGTNSRYLNLENEALKTRPRNYKNYLKNPTLEFPKKSTLQFLSIKYFRPLGIKIELLTDHITVVVLYRACKIKTN